MEKVLSFDSWKELNEKKGVSRAIQGHLMDFLKKHGEDASFEDAKEFISDKVDGWELSMEDFEEAKGMMKNESLSESEEEFDDNRDLEEISEGAMKAIAMIAKDAKSKEDFEKKLKEHFKKVDPELAEDEELVASYVEAWEEQKKEDEEDAK
jgi:hydroxymethylpyrimidine pyrophosphatase-like HAD family hydrolase